MTIETIDLGLHKAERRLNKSLDKNKLRYFILACLLISPFLILACSTRTSPARSTEQISAPSQPLDISESKPAWQIEWDDVVKMARKEGKVTIYGPPGVEIGRALTTGFQNRFNIVVDWIALPGAIAYPRIAAERKAGLYLIDVQIGGATTMLTRLKPDGALDPIKPILILPEVLETSAWLGGKLHFLDKEGLVLKFVSYAAHSIVINSNLVIPGEIKSYKDLLNPKWKGKIVINDPTQPGTSGKWFGVTATVFLDYNYMRQIAKQEPIVSRDRRLQVDWLAKGRVAIAIAPDTTSVTEFKQAGAPIQEVKMLEGTHTAGGYGNVAFMNRPPHPNAAKVFINWLLSKEGQTLFSNAYNTPSSRLDVSTEGIEPIKLIIPGEKYFTGGDDEEFIMGEPERFKIAQVIFGHLLR